MLETTFGFGEIESTETRRRPISKNRVLWEPPCTAVATVYPALLRITQSVKLLTQFQ